MSNHRQKVLISVDTEGPAGSDPVESLIFGRTESGKEYGIQYLMYLFDKYEAKGLFFVDFAEAWDYGADKIESVVNCILQGGHDVGVHLHPDHMADKDRRYLWQYSFDEQYEMISKCTDFYANIVGKKPVSFRAGRYGANNDTIKILDQLGYKYDMSEFYGNKYCRFEPALCCNRVMSVNNSNVIEVPVTSFRSFKSPFYSRFDKIDCSMDFREFKRVMKVICNTESVDVVSLFVHSFSVLDWRKNPDRPVLCKKLQEKLIDQLEWVYKNSEAVFITEFELNEVEVKKRFDSELDVSSGLMPYWFFIERGVKVLKDRIIRNV